MPTTPAAMRAHLTADPPAGHGMTDADMPMAEMEQRHESMHGDGAGHEHTMMSASVESARKAFIPHEFKLDATGSIELAFAQLNVIDADGDVTVPGAFPAKDVPLSAYGHTSWDGALPVGKGTISEVGDWAVLKGQFFMDTTAGRETHATLKGLGPLAEFSYGYNPADFSYGTQDGKSVRFLRRLDVFEVSPVLRGAGVGTHIRAIKSGAPGPDAPFATQLSWYSEGLPALLDRFKGHAAARLTEGRKLSRADRAALEDLVDTLDGQLTAARNLLADPLPKALDVTIEVLLAEARRIGVPIPA
jgi:hypothetical protein